MSGTIRKIGRARGEDLGPRVQGSANQGLGVPLDSGVSDKISGPWALDPELLVERDGFGRGLAPDEADEQAVEGDAPALGCGLGIGVDVEAAEEAVDALVGEAALAEEADFVLEGGVDLGFGRGDEA